METNYLAAAVLFFTPAVSVELLTGNTPLTGYLNPVTFVILNVVYGAALVLVREARVQWRKDFASVFVLAFGYGIVNEALGTKGFFDPHFYAFKGTELEGFGRVFGINAPWALNISIFHAVYSILVPYTLVSAIFPGSSRWIGDKACALLLAALIGATALLFVFVSPYRYAEGPGPILSVMALLAIIIWAARKMPAIQAVKWGFRPNSAVLFFAGAAYLAAFFILPAIELKAFASPAIYMSSMFLAFVALPALLIVKLPKPTTRGKIALAAGLLSPLVAQSAFHGGLIPGGLVTALAVVAWMKGGR